MKNLEKFTLKNNLTMNIKGGRFKEYNKKEINCCPDVIDPNVISAPSSASTN